MPDVCIKILLLFVYIFEVHSDFLEDIEGPWKCPENKCWTNIDRDMFNAIVNYKQKINIQHWDDDCKMCYPNFTQCTSDNTILLNEVSYSCAEYYQESVEEKCESTSEFNYNFTGMMLGPLRDRSDNTAYCDTSAYVCTEKYQFIKQIPGGKFSCQDCLMTEKSCAFGTYPKRCVQNIHDKCESCQYPVLPNTTMYRYGEGFLFEDCGPRVAPFDVEYDFRLCAFFMTPKWNHGYCNIECNDGFSFINISQNKIPYCVKCETSCVNQFGMIPPICNGGRFYNHNENEGRCIKCQDRGYFLPFNAHWYRNMQQIDQIRYDWQWCQWECDFGYYWDSIQRQCTSCFYDMPNCIQIKESRFAHLIKCTNSSRGECEYCVSNCSRGFYMNLDVWNEECTCMDCKQPVLGETYIVQECRHAYPNSFDTVLGRCRNHSCPVGQYISKNCTLNTDVQCSNCTGPINGKLLKNNCSVYNDTVYQECPFNKSCNGSSVIMDCPNDREALNGICECPRGMQFQVKGSIVSDICIPLSCKRGQYMDKQSAICKNCSYFSNLSSDDQKYVGGSSISLSNPLVMGRDSCYCLEYFFILKNSSAPDSIQCWPCGDLKCNELGFERQSICNGMSDKEPICECIGPPTTKFILNDISVVSPGNCVKYLSCEDNFNSLIPMQTIHQQLPHSVILYNIDAYTFVYRTPNFHLKSYFMSNGDLNRNIFHNQTIRDLVAIDSQHLLVLCYSTSNIELTSLYILYFRDISGQAFELNKIDLSILSDLQSEYRISVPKIIKIFSHTRKDPNMYEDIKRLSKIWILTSYDGYCSNDMKNANQIGRCSALNLLSFRARQYDSDNNCYFLYCLKVVYAYWGGYNFALYGTTYEFQSMTLGNIEEDNDNSVYFLGGGIDENIIFKYSLIFHVDKTSFDNYDDQISIFYAMPRSLSNPSFLAFSFIVDISMNARGLLAIVAKISNKRVQERPYEVELWYWNLLYARDNSLQTTLNTTVSWFMSTAIYYNSNLCFVESSSYHIGLVRDGSSLWSVDVWNKVVSTYFDLRDNEYSTSENKIDLTFSNFMTYTSVENAVPIVYFSTFALYRVYGQSEITIKYMWNVGMCSVDLIFHKNNKGCTSLFCQRTNPCGLNSFRDFSSNICKCFPGYAYIPAASENILAECKACTSSMNSYCPGGLNNAISCPPNSVVQKHLASNIEDCYCLPTFYSFNNYCIPCLKNSFCPFNGTVIPTFCHQDGTTAYQGELNPLSCLCPQRTYGIQCTPCSDSDLCEVIDNNMPLSVMNIGGISSFIGMEYLKTCLISEIQNNESHIIYTIPKGYSLSLDLYSENFILSTNITMGKNIFWNWIIVFQSNRLSLARLSTCMNEKNRFWNYTSKLLYSNYNVESYRSRQTCDEKFKQPGFWEWNGKSGYEEDCTCIAGYEKVQYNPDWWGLTSPALNLKCFPCLNGTFRSRRASSDFCVPCKEQDREYAPYLGMSHCICRPGYILSGESKLCKTESELQNIMSSSYPRNVHDIPSWYSFMHDPTTFTIVITCTSVFVFIIIYLFFMYN